uniref:Uncharacterized protein n=1 Tax=Timema shepardi TaxID=629360 RepID=A0A7R9AM37_TIMSH|nr:unnamed protein product [Timema shepardi]
MEAATLAFVSHTACCEDTVFPASLEGPFSRDETGYKRFVLSLVKLLCVLVEYGSLLFVTDCSSLIFTIFAMRSAIVILALLIAVGAVPLPQEPLQAGIIPVLQRTEVRDEAGQFSLSYLSGDGTTLNEQGALKPTADGTDNVLVKQGSFSYTSPEGIPISLTYVADELGFRPEGSHLPVAPAVPPINF